MLNIGPTLRDRLTYQPRELKFGTSGRRGEVIHLSQLEIYINALSELEYLLSLPPAEGGITAGDTFYFATDLRPSSTAFVPEQGGRGEIAQTILRAISDAGLLPVYLGRIPTPALTAYAISQGKGSIMVTGSHIPFDRNGYKVNTARGELLKKDEDPINQRVAATRQRLYRAPFESSLFTEQGALRAGHQDLPAESPVAAQAYSDRYANFFGAAALSGLRLLLYQHSAVGRDLVVDILRRLGAEVVATGRSETFVPIDTENIDAAQLAALQSLYDEAVAQHGPFDALVSTDGDSDRPLILGIDHGRVHFFPGDLVGMITAESLGADAVVVPISCSDALDRGPLAPLAEPRTRIGSPHVIVGMEQARARGKRTVCGWEANGGFLTGSDILRQGQILTALPTRDAVLPIVAVLTAAKTRGLPLVDLFNTLPRRYSRAALLKDFPRSEGLALVARLTPTVAGDTESIRQTLAKVFTPEAGFAPIMDLNYTDGVRIYFANGEVAHLRPSGNADEFRFYAVADTEPRALQIANQGIAEPNGLLRQLARTVQP
jgi:phosphomannomutase